MASPHIHHQSASSRSPRTRRNQAAAPTIVRTYRPDPAAQVAALRLLLGLPSHLVPPLGPTPTPATPPDHLHLPPPADELLAPTPAEQGGAS